MNQIVALYKEMCPHHSPTLFYQTKVFIELLKNIKHHSFYEVGAGQGYFSLLAGLHEWHVIAFEINPDKYSKMCQNIRNHQLTQTITPIYTQIGLNPSLDHFVGDQHVGIVKINVGGNEIEVVDGLKRSLQRQLIECLMVNICPKFRPTNFWLELIIYIEQLGYKIYNLNIHIKKTDNSVKLIPFEIDDIHKTPETTLLFIKTQ